MLSLLQRRPDDPVPPSAFEHAPELVFDAMFDLQSEIDQWRAEIEAECEPEILASVERAIEAVMARAKEEMFS